VTQGQYKAERSPGQACRDKDVDRRCFNGTLSREHRSWSLPQGQLTRDVSIPFRQYQANETLTSVASRMRTDAPRKIPLGNTCRPDLGWSVTRVLWREPPGRVLSILQIGHRPQPAREPMPVARGGGQSSALDCAWIPYAGKTFRLGRWLSWRGETWAAALLAPYPTGSQLLPSSFCRKRGKRCRTGWLPDVQDPDVYFCRQKVAQISPRVHNN
jgi:hypothetical protein